LLIDGEMLTPSDQRLKEELQAGEEGRLLVDELRTGVRIAARSWVGIVRFERFEVRVVPKLAGDNIGLVEMIEFATGLDALRRSSSARSLHAEGTGLFDLIALLLAEGTELILRCGLLADYVEREDELRVLRGRLLSDRQVLRRFGQVDRLVCRFDEHEQDIAENQLLGACPSNRL
jgi:5-methylcytosine-specific restriction enzyme subunit McrC